VAADEWPGEATTAVALSVDLLRYAMQPASLDLAIVVVGDSAYVPLLQEVRRLGKRVVVATIRGAAAPELVEPRDPAGVRDFEVAWLGPLLGPPDRPQRRGRPPDDEQEAAPSDLPPGQDLSGRIKNIIWDRGYGFIAAEDGRDYFFHANALEGGLEFDGLQPDLVVSFEVKSGPVHGRAGAARRVWRAGDAPTPPVPVDGDPQPAAAAPPAEASDDEDGDDQPLAHLHGSPPPD
jgi:cold shock CspA family protein